MTDLLAIVGPADADERLLTEIARRRPQRVTVLMEAERDWAIEESLAARAARDRLAGLLHAIERRTGAVVVGMTGDADQLRGWRFDRVVGGHLSVAA